MSLSSLASGFGLKLFMFININWTNVDQRNNTYNFLNVMVLNFNYSNLVVFLFLLYYLLQTATVKDMEMQSWS